MNMHNLTNLYTNGAYYGCPVVRLSVCQYQIFRDGQRVAVNIKFLRMTKIEGETDIIRESREKERGELEREGGDVIMM